MIFFVAILAASPPATVGHREKNRPNPFDQFDPKPKPLGPGPHTLLVSNVKGLTRFEYKSGAACQRARDAIRQQQELPASSGLRVVVPGVTAVCVPR